MFDIFDIFFRKMNSLEDHLDRLLKLDSADLDCRFHEFEVDSDEHYVAKSLVNESQYVGKRLSTDERVPGHIGDPKYYSFWRDVLQAPEYVLSIIREGYKIPFSEIPPSSICQNNRSFLNNSEFGIAELERLNALGCISKVSEKPYIVLPLTVVYSKKLRLVVDASRTLNPFIIDQKVKLEGLNIAEQLVQQNDWQTTSDLDSGYWHVPLHKDFKKYVGVHAILPNGETVYYVWNVLFNLKS